MKAMQSAHLFEQPIHQYSLLITHVVLGGEHRIAPDISPECDTNLAQNIQNVTSATQGPDHGRKT